jgi:cytochrome c-type biogenesis protein CcsB
MSSRIYLSLTLALYAVGAAHVLLQAMTRRRLFTAGSLTATFAGFALHTAALSQRWTEAGQFPALGLHDGASFLGWSMVLAFLVVSLRTRVDALGLLVHPAAFALLLVANLVPPSEADRPLLRGLFLPLHATLALAGYSALFVAFAMGVLYLVQERELRGRAPHTFYYVLPSLERCDTLGGRSAILGFPLLTLAMVTGALWSYSAHGRFWSWDAKSVSAMLAWGLYVAIIVARHRSGWGGRRAAWMSIAGFIAVVFAFFWASAFSGSAMAAR